MGVLQTVEALVYAFGAPANPSALIQDGVPKPYPETLRVLDSIVTDFLIELSHSVAQTANYSGRQKIKTEDVYFALRKDPIKLARVQEMLIKDKKIKGAKKALDVEKEAKNDLAAVAEEAGVEEGIVKGPGRGRRKRILDDATSEGGKSKKSRTSKTSKTSKAKS